MAGLDIGTNSVLLLVCRVDGNGVLREVHEDIRMPRIGEDVGLTGKLSAPAVERTLAAVGELLDGLPPASRGRGVAATTSAVRDADNRDIFLTAFADRFGRPPLLLSGSLEADTIFFGVAQDMLRDNTLLVNVDVGGGSTEIAAGDRERGCELTRSLNIGCVRLGEKFNLYGLSGRPQHRKARREIRGVIEPVVEEIKQLAGRRAFFTVASAGTATSFVSWRRKMKRYDRDRVHGFSAREDEVASCAEELAGISLNERMSSPYILHGRAAVMPTGLLILSEVLRVLQVAQFTVSARGLRYGLVMRLQQGDLEPVFWW